MKDKYIKVFTVKMFFIISVSLFLSCQIGLGDAIDLAAPEINVTTPASNSSTGTTVLIKGTVSDNECLSYFTISVSKQNVENKNYKYEFSTGSWFELNENGSWKTGTELNPINALYSGNTKNGNWEISVPLTGNTGDKYTIKSRVYDNYKNDGSKSSDMRVITLDTVEPTVSIISPAIFTSYSEITEKNFVLRNNDTIRYLNNNDIELEGIQVEDTILGDMYIYIDNKTDLSLDKDNIINDCIVYKKIKGERSWSTLINSSDFKKDLGNDRNYLRLVTQSFDIAGNEKWTVHGWFVYWNDADIPWVTADFGDNESKVEGASVVYPECAMQGQAFDDDGIKKIIIDLLKKNSSGQFIKDIDLSEEIDLTENSYPTYYSWSVKAPGESCEFKVEVKCIDKFNKESETAVRYLHVKDVTPPTLAYNLDTGKTLVELCDASGNFSFSGKVKDDGNIKDDGLRIVRINNENDLVSYFNSSYDGWKAPSINPSASKWEDSNGNKVWVVPLSGSGKEREFTQTFNIFNDFGVDLQNKKYLSTQNFVIMATDATGVSTLESFALQGDNKLPEFNISKVQIFDSTGKSKSGYTITDFTSTQTLGVLNEGDKIQFSGSWSDDSSKFTSKKTGEINLIWNEVSDDSKKIITKNSDGTWNSSIITIPSGTSSLSTLFTYTDLGGKSVSENFAVYFKSSKPEFLQYGSNNSDKSYKAGDVIEITMEFNKKVKFEGSAKNPKLKLNVKNESNTQRYAEYESGNNTAKHIYKYTVMEGDNVSDLNVTGIDADTNVWSEVISNDGSSAEVIAGITNMHINDSSSLASGRDIVIDTVSPIIVKESVISSQGSYNSGKNIYFELEFSEAVEISNVNAIKLKLNITNKSNPVYALGATKTGDKTYRFKYQIKNDDMCASKVVAEELLLGTASIVDNAGNNLSKNGLSSYLITNHGSTIITVDTEDPSEPVININGSNTGFVKTYYEAPVISIPVFESGNPSYEETSIKKISKDNGRTYEDYTGPITLSKNGMYEITAYHEDEAGNRVVCSKPVTINVDAGKVLDSISANVPDGTYTTGRKLSIKLYFRKAAYINAVTPPSIMVNVKRGDDEFINIPYKSGNGSKILYFEYEVLEGDSCVSGLDVISIAGKLYDEAVNGTEINDYADVTSLSIGNKLIGSRTIKISTNTPEIQSTYFNDEGTKLIIKFNKEIKKNVGDIIITQTNDSFRAPSVVSKETYDLFPDVIKNYYVSGTNGASYNLTTQKYVSDVVEKYILSEDSTTNTLYLNNNETLCNLFKNNYSSYMTVTVPVTSGSVSVSGNELIIDITGTYKVPVKGANYNISIPVDIVKDSLGLKNVSSKIENNLFHPGCENPTIRIQKKKETVMENTNPVQPFEVPVVIDCRTPDASISYQKIQKSNSSIGTISLSSNNANQVNPISTTDIKKTDESNITTYPFEEYESSFNIGLADSSDNNKKGCKILISAKAKKSYDLNDYDCDSTVLEMAYRTVLYYYDQYNNKSGDTDYNDYLLKTDTDSNTDDFGWRWIRGGDNTAGGVSTPGFPLSWNTGHYKKIRAMTCVMNNNKRSEYWYWITWDLNVPAYFHILTGNMPNDCENGPSIWCWSANGLVAQKSKYPLYPGDSLQYNQSASGNSGTLTFFKKHREQRTTPQGITDASFGDIPYIAEVSGD